jgi:hypothetical protein
VKRSIAVLGLLILACGQRMQIGETVPVDQHERLDRLATNAATVGTIQLGCPSAQATVQRMGAGMYRVAGCDRLIDYLCADVGDALRHEVRCSVQSSGGASPASPAAP